MAVIFNGNAGRIMSKATRPVQKKLRCSFSDRIAPVTPLPPKVVQKAFKRDSSPVV